VISTIAGTAGVGKTALAVHWAHRVADHFPDGQLYLNLRGYATGAPPLRPIEALSALLRSLGTPPEQIPTDEARAAARYRTTLAHRRILIVLDNARTVDQVRPLLPGNPGCLVLITSRDNLTGLVARDGARRLVLDLLDPHEAAELVVHLLSPDRADAEPGGAAELARACAHLPLAIRIAAAHLLDHSDQTITEYTSLLAATDRLAALRIEGDEAGAVLAALEMSYQRTPAAAQRLFRLLGLVPGPSITAVAAAALLDAPAPEAASLLRHLTRIHLIEEYSPDRFAFHDLLRLYAQRLAEEQDGDEVRAGAVQRLFASYLHTVASAATVLYPELLRFPLPPAGDGQPIPDISQPDRAMAWLSAELPNLVAAIEYAAEHGPRHLPWRLADQLRGYFLGCRNAVDHLGSARMSLLAAERDGDPTALAVAHLGIASYYFVAADYPASIEHATSAAEHAGAAGWLDGQAAALGNLGVAYGHLGHLRQAAENHARSLALKQRTGRLGGQAVSRSNLGMIYEEMGRLWQAEEQLTSALDSFHQIGSARGEAAARSTLACVYHQLGRLDLASTHASRAFEAFQDIGDQDGQSGALGILALVSSDAGQLTGAQDYARASMSLAMEIDNAAAMTMAHIAQGTVQLLRGRPGDARAHHQRALELARDSGHRIGEVTALLGLSAADRRLGRLATAAQAAQDCLDLARRTGYRVLEGRALTSLAEICGDQRDLDGADRPANEALRAHRETGHRLGEARTLAVLGQIADARGQPDHARQHRREALALFHDIGAPAPEDVRGADVTESGPAGPH
jgi:tetratricopeptide (TPR) repeat protein